MPTTPEQIDDYFAKLDWPYTKREATLWDSGYVGETYRVRFVVRLTDRWLYVNALLPVKIQAACRANFLEHLARLNFTLNGVKLYLDPDDDITLSMEMLSEDLEVDQFETALYSVCSNADRHFVELIRLATDPNAVSSLKPGAAAEASDDSSGSKTTGSSGSSPNGSSPGIDWSETPDDEDDDTPEETPGTQA
jgi:hypothetical protein